ncbi:MAG: beta-ketoacyl synthase N-terminal-like domain-containing protein [Planctomycetaceae bacterium]
MDAGEASSQAALMAAIDLLRSGKCERVVCGGAQQLDRNSSKHRHLRDSSRRRGESLFCNVSPDALQQLRTIYGLIIDVEVSRETSQDSKTEQTAERSRPPDW